MGGGASGPNQAAWRVSSAVTGAHPYGMVTLFSKRTKTPERRRMRRSFNSRMQRRMRSDWNSSLLECDAEITISSYGRMLSRSSAK